MDNLYKNLATVYEAMYQTFINYPEEYALYNGIIQKYQKQNVLEIGSGTGHLAQLFLRNNVEYIGLDFSFDMIKIAQKKVEKGHFMQGDMRDFQLKTPIESAIITGRTISYLLKNQDVLNAFSSIHHNLSNKGILCFDFIDASQFIPSLANEKTIIHEAQHNDIQYIRKSIWNTHLTDGMAFDWQSIYYKKENNQLLELGQDHSIIRAFTLQEIEIFLKVRQFNILEVIEKAAYAFPTFVIVAQKI